MSAAYRGKRRRACIGSTTWCALCEVRAGKRTPDYQPKHRADVPAEAVR